MFSFAWISRCIDFLYYYHIWTITVAQNTELILLSSLLYRQAHVMFMFASKNMTEGLMQYLSSWDDIGISQS